jgi:hypothetical protein
MIHLYLKLNPNNTFQGITILCTTLGMTEKEETYTITHWHGLGKNDVNPDGKKPAVIEVKATKEFLAGIITAVVSEQHTTLNWDFLMKIEHKTDTGSEPVTLEEYFHPYLVEDFKEAKGDAKIPADKHGYMVHVGVYIMYSPTRQLLDGIRFGGRLLGGENYVDTLNIIYRHADGDVKQDDDGEDMIESDGIIGIAVDGKPIAGNELYDDWKEHDEYVDDSDDEPEDDD